MSMTLSGSFAPFAGATKFSTPPPQLPIAWSTNTSHYRSSNFSFSNSNQSVTSVPSSTRYQGIAAGGMSSGKYYWEAKYEPSTNNMFLGLTKTITTGDLVPNNVWEQNIMGTFIYTGVGSNLINSQGEVGGATYVGTAQVTGDTMGFAVDMDAGVVFISRNGVWKSSATQSSIGSGSTTGAVKSGLTGTWYPFYADFTTGAATVTINADTNNLLYPVPDGYNTTPYIPI